MRFSSRLSVFHVETLELGVTLVEVNGALQDAAIEPWTGLLERVIAEGAADIVVDLRGCAKIDSDCYSALVQVSAKMKADGGGGVRLVTYPGSPPEGEFGGPEGELPVHATLQQARRYFRDGLPAGHQVTNSEMGVSASLRRSRST